MNVSITSEDFRCLRCAFVFPLLVIATLFLGWNNGAAAEQKVFKWNLQSAFPPTTDEFRMIKEGLDELRTATNGAAGYQGAWAKDVRRTSRNARGPRQEDLRGGCEWSWILFSPRSRLFGFLFAARRVDGTADR